LRLAFVPSQGASIDISKFIDALTIPLTGDEMKSGTYIPPKHEGILMTGTYDEVLKAFTGELRWGPFGGGPWAEMTDGLPIVPPTEERVAAMLQGTSHDPDETIRFTGFMTGGGRKDAGKGKTGGTSQGVQHIATVKKVAINAVMAGCKPEDMPVVLAIAESGACVGYYGESSFGHMYTVSGPYAKEIGMNSGFGFLNPGNPANTRLQRACTLMGINLGGSKPAINNNERTGTLHWGTTFAENEDSPWPGLNEYFGYSPDESVLLAWDHKVQLVPFQQIEVLSAVGPRQDPIAPVLTALGTLTNDKAAIVLFTPDTADSWAGRLGFETRQELQDYIWENVTWKKGVWMNNYWFRLFHKSKIDRNPRGSRMLNPDYYDLPDDADVPMFLSPEAITIIVAGGQGNAWAWGGADKLPRVISIDKWR